MDYIYDALSEKPLNEKKVTEWNIEKDESGEVLRKVLAIVKHSQNFREGI